jgi:hypothetical protein
MTDWGMYSEAGNRQVQALVEQIAAGIRSGDITLDTYPDALESGFETIEDAGFPEVYDTDVRESVYAELDPLFNLPRKATK